MFELLLVSDSYSDYPYDVVLLYEGRTHDVVGYVFYRIAKNKYDTYWEQPEFRCRYKCRNKATEELEVQCIKECDSLWGTDSWVRKEMMKNQD